MKKYVIAFVTCVTLSGCLGNFSLDGITATSASTTAAVVGTAVGGPIAGAAAGVVAGVGADLALAPDNKYEAIAHLPKEYRAEALKAEYMYDTIHSLGKWIIAAVAGLFFLPIILGAFISRKGG